MCQTRVSYYLISTTQEFSDNCLLKIYPNQGSRRPMLYQKSGFKRRSFQLTRPASQHLRPRTIRLPAAIFDYCAFPTKYNMVYAHNLIQYVLHRSLREEKISDYKMSYVFELKHCWIIDACVCARAEILSMCPKECNIINRKS